MVYSFLSEWDYTDPRTFVVAINGENARDRILSIQEDIEDIRGAIARLAVKLSADDVVVSDDFADYAGHTGVFDERDPGFPHRGRTIQLDPAKGWGSVCDTVSQLVALVNPDNTFVAW